MVLRKSYLDKIIPFIDQDLIKVLVGIRRCGKTVLLGQIKDVLLQRNIPAQNIIQANFESMRFRNTRTAETLYDYIAEKAEGCTGKIYILLDEIQEVERWQIAINSLRVDFDCDIYLTGSNSKLLSGELATYLSGRYIQIQVFPFSLAEAKQQCIENGTYTSDEKLFADYLKYGGFPQRFFLPDDHSITTYLDDLYEAIIVRDIMLRHSIREQTALRNVLAFLLDNIGNPFSARNISGRMVSEGIKTTTATVLNYVDYFKEAFILLNASRYDIKGKALLSSTEKYYAVDLGLRNVIKKSEKLDSNKLYENIVYLEMRSRGYEVQVGKLDDTEIDFICYRGNEKLYIQVAYLITPADEEREFGNLERLHDNYPKYVISGDLVNLSRNGIIHVLNAFTEVNDLQHAGFLDELLLFLQDQSLISSCDTATVLIRQRQNLPDLELVQSLERKGNFVNGVSIHLNFHICDERTNNAPNLINGRQRDIKNRNVIFQLTRNDRHFRDNKNRSTVILVIEVVFRNALHVRNYFGIIQFPVDILQNQEGLLLKTIIHGQLQKFFQRAALHRAFGLKVHKSKRIVELHTFCTLPNVRNCCIDHLEIKVVNVNDRVQRVNVGSQDIFCTAFHPYTSM